jgi:transketolase
VRGEGRAYPARGTPERARLVGRLTDRARFIGSRPSAWQRYLAMITTGSELHPCLAAADSLAASGISARVIDMHTISPLDAGEIVGAASQTGAVLTVEEHNVTGGLGSAVAETLADAGLAPAFRRLGVPDAHVALGPPAALYAHYDLDAAGIESAAKHMLAS